MQWGYAGPNSSFLLAFNRTGFPAAVGLGSGRDNDGGALSRSFVRLRLSRQNSPVAKHESWTERHDQRSSADDGAYQQ